MYPYIHSSLTAVRDLFLITAKKKTERKTAFLRLNTHNRGKMNDVSDHPARPREEFDSFTV